MQKVLKRFKELLERDMLVHVETYEEWLEELALLAESIDVPDVEAITEDFYEWQKSKASASKG